MIKADVLEKKYGDFIALRGVSFTIGKKVTSIIGRNGAGKTTLLRILTTQLLQTSGTASINGCDVVRDAKEIREFTMSVPQEAKPVYFRTALDSVRLYLGARGMGTHEARLKAERALKQLGLWSYRNKISNELSGGTKRKIFIAMAMASNPKVIFLDEPTTGLDPLSRLETWSAIRSLKGQVVITTHYMEEAQALSDEVILLDHGSILAQGTVEELLKPFAGMVRIESAKKKKAQCRIGNTWISYVKKEKAESFVKEGDIVKPITLDDLFVKRGVDLES